jgi:hypothetical protein
MTMKNRAGVALLALLATGACMTEDEVDTSSTSAAPLVVDDEGALWTGILGVAIVPMCWQWTTGFNATEEAAVKERVQSIVEEGWVAYTRLHVFWVDCPTSGDEHHVRVTLNKVSGRSNGNTVSFGTKTLTTADERANDPLSHLPGLLLDIDAAWDNTNQDRAKFRGFILHEFGHVLGFGHEMRHPDGSPQDNLCYETTESGGIPIGPPDQNSIMGASDPVGRGKYCQSLSQINRLSPGDIEGARQIYGVAATHFGSPQKWSDVFCVTDEECRLGDVDGDGQDDIIAFEHGRISARVWVGLSSGMIGGHHIPYYFAAPNQVLWSFCALRQSCEVADVNGDGRDDLVAFTRGTTSSPQAIVALSNGAGFEPPHLWSSFSCRAGEVCKLADVTGDGAADVVVFSQNAPGEVWVQPALGVPGPTPVYSGFGSPQGWATGFCTAGQICAVGDVDGDGRADAVAFTRGGNARVLVAASTGGGFTGAQQVNGSFCLDGQECLVADVNGDHRADAIAFTHDGSPRALVARAAGVGLKLGSAIEWSPSACGASETCMVGDVNGDGYGDAVVATRSPDNDIYVNPGNI